jgi:hypothetical protein
MQNLFWKSIMCNGVDADRRYLDTCIGFADEDPCFRKVMRTGESRCTTRMSFLPILRLKFSFRSGEAALGLI